MLFDVLFSFLPIFISGLTTLVLTVYILRKKSNLKRILSVPRMPFLAGWAVLSLIAGLIHRNYLGDAAFLLYFSYILFGFFAYYVMTGELVRQLLRLTSVLSILAAAAAFIQKFTGMDRPVSTFFNANYYGYICEIVLLTSFYGLMKMKDGRVLYLLSIFANICGILLSGCRSAWLASLGGLLVILLCLGRVKEIIALAVAGCTGVAVILTHPQLIPRSSSLDTTTELRVRIWKLAVKGFLQCPLIGRGFMGYWQISAGQGRACQPHAHNILLNSLDSYGVIGTALLLFFIIPLVVLCVKKLRTQPVCGLVLGMITAILIHGITDDTTLGIQTGIFTLIMLAMSGAPSAEVPAAAPKR